MTDDAERLLNIVVEHVETWQSILKLTNWSVAVLVDKDVDACMKTSWDASYRKALIKIGSSHEGHHGREAWDLQHSSIHELVHLVLAPMTDIISTEFAQASSLRQRLEDAEETVADHLATALIAMARKQDEQG